MGPMNHIRRRRVARFPGQSKSSNDTRRHGKLAKSLPIQWMRNRPSNLLKLAGFQISAGAFPFRTEPYAWTALESFSFPDLGTCTRIIRRRDWIPSTCSWQMEWSALATWVQTLILSFRSETASTVANCLDPRSLRRDRSSTMPHQTGRFAGAFRTLRTRGKRSETSIDERTQGTIEVGKRADLVLLEADPLTDIRNTRRIDSVMVRGQLFLKPEINRIIAAHRRASP